MEDFNLQPRRVILLSKPSDDESPLNAESKLTGLLHSTMSFMKPDEPNDVHQLLNTTQPNCCGKPIK